MSRRARSTREAHAQVEAWLALPHVWVPPATERTVRILADLVRRHGVTGNLVPDAQLVALAIENGVVVASTDTDFAPLRTKVRRVNPLRR